MSKIKLVGLLSLMLIMFSCKQGANQTKESDFKKGYELAHKSLDRESTISILTQWLANDSSISNWAYDTLAYYHYFFKVNPGAVRNPSTPMFYAEKGLDINKGNTFLKDIKAKLLLEKGKDTLAFAMFEDLWKQTNDYTYYWDMTYIEIARGNITKAEEMITAVLNSGDKIEGKKVKMEAITAQITENIAAKAAFTYLNALVKNVKRDVIGSFELLKKCIEIEPNFYAAKRDIMELQRMNSGARRQQ